MNDVFCDELCDYAVVFLDDILVFSETLEEHILHVWSVLQKLRNFKLYAKLSKCDFFQKEITYLGHHISSKGVSIDKSKMEAVLKWMRPSNVKEVRSFLGFIGFLRRSLQHCSHYTTPFTDLLRGIMRKSTKAIEWNDSLENSFNELKKLIMEAPTFPHNNIKHSGYIWAAFFKQNYYPLVNITSYNSLEGYKVLFKLMTCESQDESLADWAVAWN